MEAEKIVDDMLSPDGQEKLKPLADLMSERGWPLGAEKALMLAQKEPRLAGKSPSELAEMIRQDESIYDDLEAMDSGALDKAKSDMFGGKMPAIPADEPTDGGDMEMEGMSEELESSATMKGADPKKASKAAKGKKPSEMNFDQKSAFMSEMSGE